MRRWAASGMPGAATIHANSAADAVAKLCTLPLLAGENVTSGFVLPAVASSIDLVVHAALGSDGTRRVEEVLAVTGRVEGGTVETSTLFVRNGLGDLVRGTGWPPHRERFARHGVDLAALLGSGA